MPDFFDIKDRRTALSAVSRLAVPAFLFAAMSYACPAAAQKLVAKSDDRHFWAIQFSNNCALIHFTEQMGILEPYETQQQLAWDGPCNADGLAHGAGTLTYQSRKRHYANFGPKESNEKRVLKASFNNGLLEGRGTLTLYSDYAYENYNPGAKMVQIPQSPPFMNPSSRIYRGGCRIDRTTFWEDCNASVAAALRDKVRGILAQQRSAPASPPAPAPAAPAASPVPDVAALQGRAERGDATAQFGLAEMLVKGTGLAKDLAQAVQWYRRAADQGHDPAQLALGLMYKNGDGVAKDFAQAAQWFLRAGQKGNADAQLNLGFLFGAGQGVTRDDAQAAQWFRRAADQDHDIAQLALGVMYRNGDGVVKDLAQAAQWFLRAAQKDNAQAQTELGHIYSEGNGVARSDTEAVRWYRAAADKGDAIAQNQLGWMYEQGRGLPQDGNLALQWYRRAADQGQVNAQTSVGFMYAQGSGGLPQDHVQAVQWYRRAADQGFAIAQANLGFAYENGAGVPKDLSEAMRWFRLAAEQGHAKAREALDRLSGGNPAAPAASPQQTVVASPTSQAGICRSVDDFSRSFDQIRAQYPQRSHWGSRDNLLWSAFMMERGIELLKSCGSGLSRADYDANMNAMVNARDSSLRSCEQLSTVSGSCRPAYP